MATSNGTFKSEKCKVLFYHKDLKVLDIDFMGYGIRIDNVTECDSVYVNVKYKGEIGSPNFTYKLA